MPHKGANTASATAFLVCMGTSLAYAGNRSILRHGRLISFSDGPSDSCSEGAAVRHHDPGVGYYACPTPTATHQMGGIP
jgi:hypothetical protein